jgi:hypothetical protein
MDRTNELENIKKENITIPEPSRRFPIRKTSASKMIINQPCITSVDTR